MLLRKSLVNDEGVIVNEKSGKCASAMKRILRLGPKTTDHPRLGKLIYVRRLGWVGNVTTGKHEVRVVLGSDGEVPNPEMVSTVCQWIGKWDLFRPAINRDIEKSLSNDEWSGEPSLPDPRELALESFQVLWSDKPRLIMIRFGAFDDDRAWFVTYDEDQFRGLSFDH